MCRRRLVGRVVLILSAALAAACARVPAPVAPADPAPAPSAPAPTAPAAAVVPKQAERGTAAWLFPGEDWQNTYDVQDEGKQAAVRVTEELIRDGDRVVAVYNGKPYVTWIVNDSGVWRQDPRGGGTLLRYLPPVLERELYWKQASGDVEVWFHLSEESTADSRRYWRLTVLNRGELTAFSFDALRGPFRVESDDRQNPANSFVKTIVTDRAGALGAAERTAFLQQSPPATGVEASVVAVTSEEFEAAVLREPVSAADLNGDGKHELIFMQSGLLRVTAQDGSLIREFPFGTVGRNYHINAHVLPGGQILVQLSMLGRCFKGGPETTFLWYDAKTAAFRTHPEQVVGDCLMYTYKGDGQFEIYQSHNGGPTLYTDQAHWENGKFVTDSRKHGLILSAVTEWNLDKVLNLVAASDVPTDGLFRSPDVLKQFKEKTSRGDWVFKREDGSPDEIRYAVSRDGQAAGTVTVKIGPQTAANQSSSGEAMMILAMVWAD